MKKLSNLIILISIMIGSLLKVGTTIIKTKKTEFKYTNNGIQDFRAEEKDKNANA